MKRLLIILSLPFMVNTSLAQDSKVETITIKTSIACSHCMACGSCGARIDSHIQEGKGIRKVKINPELNTIEVTYNEQKRHRPKSEIRLQRQGMMPMMLKQQKVGSLNWTGAVSRIRSH